MAISLNSSLVFMFITSLCVCAKVQFTASQKVNDPQEDYWTEFMVAFYDGVTEADQANQAKLVRSLTQNNSHVCILRNQSFFLRLGSFYQAGNENSPKFDISIDSAKYEGGNDVSSNHFNKEELCFTWGIWKPNLNRTKKYSKIFFNIITDEEVIKRGYLFIIDTRINGSLFSVDLQVHMFDSATHRNYDFFSNFYLVALAENEDDAYKTKVTFSDDANYVGEGDGDMVIPRIVQKGEVAEIQNAILYAKGSRPKHLRDLARLNIKNISFDKKGFSVAKPFKNYITGSMNILI